MVHVRTLPPSPSDDTEPLSDHTPLDGSSSFEGKMKSGRRVKTTIKSRDLAALFREWQQLRIKVSEAELAAAQQEPATETTIEESARRRRKTAGRGRTHGR